MQILLYITRLPNHIAGNFYISANNFQKSNFVFASLHPSEDEKKCWEVV